MTPSELRDLILHLDQALARVSRAEGRLSSREIRIRSYLSVLRNEAVDLLMSAEAAEQVPAVDPRA